MNPQCTTSTISQHLEVAARLGCFHHAEGIFLAGNRHLSRIITGHLQEDSAVGSTFIGLTSRMQEPRTETKTRSNMFLVTYRMASCLQRILMIGVHLNVAQQRKVISGAELGQMSAQKSDKVFLIAGEFRQVLRVAIIRKQL